MKRWVTLTVMVVAVVVGSKLLIENVLGFDLETIVRGWLDDAGPRSAAVIVLLLASDVVLPVPSSLVMVLSGAAFGVGWGALLALVGSILGEWLGFELARKFGRGFAARFVGEDDFRRFTQLLDRHGAVGVVLTRPLPIVMETMSVIAGLSRMRRTTFLMASLIGTGPIVLVYAYAGAESRRLGSVLPGVVILLSVTAVAWLWYRSRLAVSRSRRAHASACAGPRRLKPPLYGDSNRLVFGRFLPQRRAIQAEQIGRLHLVAVGDGECFLDQCGFDETHDLVKDGLWPVAGGFHQSLLERDAHRTRERGLNVTPARKAAFSETLSDIGDGDDVAPRDNRSPLEDAGQLRDVPRPRVLPEAREHVFIHAFDLSVQLLVESKNQVSDERGDVVAPIA